MSRGTPRDTWKTHSGDEATYLVTPPDGYEEATDWELQFRAAPLPYEGVVITCDDVDEGQLVDDPPVVQFNFNAGDILAIHDGFKGDVQCSLGTVLTVTLRVEDDWTE